MFDPTVPGQLWVLHFIQNCLVHTQQKVFSGLYLIFATDSTYGVRGEKFCHAEKFQIECLYVDKLLEKLYILEENLASCWRKKKLHIHHEGHISLQICLKLRRSDTGLTNFREHNAGERLHQWNGYSSKKNIEFFYQWQKLHTYQKQLQIFNNI